MKTRKPIGIMLLLLLGFSGCSNDDEFEMGKIEMEEFCLYVNTEDIDQTIPSINDFLATLPSQLSDNQKLQKLSEWLMLYPCVTEVAIVCESCIRTNSMVSEMMISFKENEITKDLILDIAMTNPLRVENIHKYYALNDVFVQTNNNFTIEDVFEFINSLDPDIDVESIDNGVYISTMSSDNLQYILDSLNAKPYTNDGNTWWTTGYLHYLTKQITIFPRLYNMRNKDYQNDWLKSMNDYQLVERMTEDHEGYIIHFKVPEGTERQWETEFKSYEFVNWTELNYYMHISFN